MSAGPRVSIVSPSLNQGRYIGDAIESVLRQDYPSIEYLVMDGVSTDGTLDILKRHRQDLRFLSEPDGGQTAALNKGFRLAQGEILAWLNCDDTYEPGAVSAVVEFMEANPHVMLVYGDATLVDAAGAEIGPCGDALPFSRERLVHEGDIIVQPAAFFRREAFWDVGGLDESLYWTMDYDLWLKLAARFPVQHRPGRLARYRWTGENKTAKGGFRRLDEIARVGRRHGAGGLPTGFRVEALGLGIREGTRCLRAGDLRGAGRALSRGAGAVLSSPRAMMAVARAGLSRARRRRSA